MIKINKIIIVPFRRNDKIIEFLGLKRPKDFGGIWQFITGKIENNESIKEAALREIFEEIRATKIINFIISEKVYTFKNWQNQESHEQLCIIQLPKITKIQISEEHEKYNWFDYNTLLELLEFDNNKDALTSAYEFALSFDATT